MAESKKGERFDRAARANWLRWLLYYRDEHYPDKPAEEMATDLGIKGPTLRSIFLRRGDPKPKTPGIDVILAIRKKWARSLDEMTVHPPPDISESEADRRDRLEQERERHLSALERIDRELARVLIDSNSQKKRHGNPR